MSILLGSIDLDGNISSSGDISFTTSGSGIIQTLTTIAANGTASYAGFSNTTASLNFGLNLINYATSQSYCVKLPQPVTGKSVTVVNKSGMDIKVFPSNTGGDINGNINGFATIPSNGTSYLFNCYENPLPGGWSVLSTSGTNQTLISEAIVSSVGPKIYPNAGWESSRSGLVFVNNDMQATGSYWGNFGAPFNFFASSVPQYTATAQPYGPADGLVTLTTQYPTNSWRRINSVTLITNLTASLTGYIQWMMSIGMDTHYYFANNPTYRYAGGFWDQNTGYPNIDPAWTNWYNNVQTPWAAANDGNGYPLLNGLGANGGGPVSSIVSVVPGTFIPGPGVSGSILAANPGDPGTAKFTINLPQQYAANAIGHTDLGARYISSFTPNGYYFDGTNYIPIGTLDAYQVKCWGIGLMNNWTNYSFPELKIIPQYNVTLN